VPVAAGVVSDAPVLTVITLLDMPAQGGGAAGGNRPQDAPLLGTYSLKPMRVALHDLCQFQRWTLEWQSHVVDADAGEDGCA